MAFSYLIANGAFIHEKAEVKNSFVGENTRVWQFASVISGSVVGKDCSIASCAIVDGAEVGDGTIISHGAFIDPGIKIGSGVFIGPLVKLCNDGWPRADKTGFDMEAFLEHDFVTTIIEDGASLGAGSTVLRGLIVGAGAMVAADATVTKNVPPHHLYKRSGEMVPIENETYVMQTRMRRAGA